MKHLLFLVMVLFPMLSWGQNIPPTGSVPGLEADKKVLSGPYIYRGTVGWHIFGFTQDAEKRVFVPGFSCIHGNCMTPEAFSAKLAAMLVTADPKATFRAAYDAEVKIMCTAAVRQECSLNGQMCREQRALQMMNWPPGTNAPMPEAQPTCGPATSTFKVKVNGTITTRPAFALVNGIRGTREIGRATVGEPCDTTKPTLASGADVWASFGPTPEVGRVALCSK